MNKLDFNTVKLYGRSQQFHSLHAAYDRVCSTTINQQDDGGDDGADSVAPASEMILVTGQSGTGKSTLVRKLKTENQQNSSRIGNTSSMHFISGKFDQQLTSEPYSALNVAFSELCDCILTCTDEDEKNKTITAINNVIDSNKAGGSKILLKVISNLYELINDDDDDDDEPNAGNNRRSSSRSSTSSSSGEFVDATTHNREALNQLKLVFREFVRCCCTPSHPVVLFLDDLQWSDNPSMEIIKSIATDSKCKHLLIVGAYRDNEVDEKHPLTRHIKDIERENKKTIERIHLTNLDEQCVNQLLSDMTRVDLETTQPLAKIIHHKTMGNIFFVLQFIKSLVEEHLLFYSMSEYKWEWVSIEEIQSETDLSDNVVDLVASKIKKQPCKVQWILKLAAAISFYFDSDFLEAIIVQKQKLCTKYEQDMVSACGGAKMSSNCEGIMKFEILENKDKLKEILDMAVNESLLDKLGGNKYKFAHDRVQQAAYSLIPEQDRDLLHLRIGGLIWKLGYFQTKSMMFLAADQLNRGAVHIVDKTKRAELAKLNLQVGKAAIKLSAFGPASSYLEAGIALLDYEDNWENQYDLSLKMYTYLADTEFCIGSFDSSRVMIEQVLQNAKCLDDKLRVYFTLVASLLAQGKLQECADTALDVLMQLGEPITTTAKARKLHLIPGRNSLGRLFSRSIGGQKSSSSISSSSSSSILDGAKETTNDQKNQANGESNDLLLALPLLGEENDKMCKLKSWLDLKSHYVNTNYKRIERLLHEKSDNDLLELPSMVDERKVAIMKLYFNVSICFWSRDQIENGALVAFRAVEITLQDGVCKESIDAFVAYAAYVVSKGKIKEACKYGRVLSKLIDKHKMKGQAGRTLHGMINHWQDPLQNGLDILLESYSVSMKTGDIDGAFMVMGMYVSTYYFCGLPLKPLLADIESFAPQMLEYKQYYPFLNTLPVWQGALNLMGRSDNPLEMDKGDAIDRKNLLPDNSEENKYKIGSQAAQSVKMQLCYYFGEFEQANEIADSLRCVTERRGTSSYIVCIRMWFFGLISLALARKKPKEKKFKREGNRILLTMRGWVEQGAVNCVHKLLLLEAESATLQYDQNNGSSKFNVDQVKEAYDHAITTASRCGFLQDTALANERAGLFFLEVAQDKNWASVYLCGAHELYSEWGAKAKADQLEADYPELITSSEKQRHSTNLRGKSRFDKNVTTYHKKISLNKL